MTSGRASWSINDMRRSIRLKRSSILRFQFGVRQSFGDVDQILKLDESCISNPTIRNCELDYNPVMQPVQSKISDFGICDSFNFKIWSTSPKLCLTPNPPRSLTKLSSSACQFPLCFPHYMTGGRYPDANNSISDDCYPVRVRNGACAARPAGGQSASPRAFRRLSFSRIPDP